MNHNGYIALMAAIIISLVLAGAAVEVASSGFYARANISDAEASEEARALAFGCADRAAIKTITHALYQGDETIVFENGTCTIFSIQSGASKIKVQATVRGAYSNVVRTQNIPVLYQEIPTL